MVVNTQTIEQVQSATERYKYGFVTEIEMDHAPKGLSEDIVRFISAKKEEPEIEAKPLWDYLSEDAV